LHFKLKRETADLKTIRNEIANLAITVTQRLKHIEEMMEKAVNKERDTEEQILRRIQSEIRFIKERFGVSTFFEVQPDVVLVTTVGAVGTVLNTCKSTKDNIYEGMITAFWSALNKRVPEQFKDLPPATLRHTEEELKEELGCDVKVINYPGH
jgi:hypothetical protein